MSGDQPPSIEKPKGPYPTYVANRFGKVVPVVQVYCYTKYLGHLELNFDHQVNFANSQIYYRHPLNFAVNVDIEDPANIKTAKHRLGYQPLKSKF